MTDIQHIPPREIPAKTIPVPSTVSPEMQRIVGGPLPPGWNEAPKDVEGWKKQVAAIAEATVKGLPALRDKLQVHAEIASMGGVVVNVLTPHVIPERNRNRVLVHMHGGSFVNFPGEAGTAEAVMMAGFGQFKVLSVDYRMPPDHPFPAALDDGMAVWQAAILTHRPENMAIFGSSAGGNLTLAMVLRAKRDGLPLPGAIGPFTPMADLTNAGDTFQTNALIDNVLVATGGGMDRRADLYRGGHDATDPMVSPLFGDFSGFPPTILLAGTRDLLLSNTVRTHRKLRASGVDAALHVFEAQSHAHFFRDANAPEAKEAFQEVASFLDRHLGV